MPLRGDLYIRLEFQLLNVPIADGVSGTEHPVALAVGPQVWELLAQLRIDTTGGLL